MRNRFKRNFAVGLSDRVRQTVQTGRFGSYREKTDNLGTGNGNTKQQFAGNLPCVDGRAQLRVRRFSVAGVGIRFFRRGGAVRCGSVLRQIFTGNKRRTSYGNRPCRTGTDARQHDLHSRSGRTDRYPHDRQRHSDHCGKCAATCNVPTKPRFRTLHSDGRANGRNFGNGKQAKRGSQQPSKGRYRKPHQVFQKHFANGCLRTWLHIQGTYRRRMPGRIRQRQPKGIFRPACVCQQQWNKNN